MLIDWFTVAAQIVNFLLLVALLRYFLWKRLVRAIDEREARVAGTLAQAEEQARDAARQMEEVQARALEMEHRREEMIVQAKKEADAERNRMIEKARETVRELETRWREDLGHERAAFFRELRKRSAGEVLKVIRRALEDLASSDVQQAAIQVFLARLHSLDLATLQAMAAEELLLRSAVALPEATQQEVRTVLRDRLSAAPRLRFECDPAMAWGLELRGNGRKIGWNPESYLDSMEENLNEALNRRADAVSRVAS